MAKKLRGNTVFARVDDKGELLPSDDGRIEIIYKKVPGAKLYRAAARNLEASDSLEVFQFDASPPVVDDAESSNDITSDPIIIYTDGGARPSNPGPIGIGAVIMDGAKRNELSEYHGHGTNQIAELTAILRALESLGEDARTREVRVHSDSSYAIGLLSKGWKAKANKELVAELRALARQFPGLRLIKVKAHIGIPENERADELATAAAIRKC